MLRFSRSSTVDYLFKQYKQIKQCINDTPSNRASRVPDRVPSQPGRRPSRLVEGDLAQPSAAGGSFVMPVGGHSFPGAAVTHLMRRSTERLFQRPVETNLNPGSDATCFFRE